MNVLLVMTPMEIWLAAVLSVVVVAFLVAGVQDLVVWWKRGRKK